MSIDVIKLPVTICLKSEPLIYIKWSKLCYFKLFLCRFLQMPQSAGDDDVLSHIGPLLQHYGGELSVNILSKVVGCHVANG